MSLIIGAQVRDGIVLAADSRGTSRDKSSTMYSDDMVKIVPFPNRIAVAHCGESILPDMTTEYFLKRFRDFHGAECQIHSMPSVLLTEIDRKRSYQDTYFIIAGMPQKYGIGLIYLVGAKQRMIKLIRSEYNGGFVCRGCSDIANLIMQNADYNYMSLDACIDLARGAVNATIEAYKHRSPQGVGGHCDMYVMKSGPVEIGWLRDGKIISDPEAPDDAFDKAENERFNKAVDHLIKTERELAAKGDAD